MNPKILLIDIETAPNVIYAWGRYEQNAVDMVEDWYMMSFSAKWLDQKKVVTYALPDFARYKKDKKDDYSLVQQARDLLDEADIVIGHNGDEFDIKKMNTRMLIHGIKQPSPYKSVDTKKLARRSFRFDSNKLDELGRQLGLGRKIDNGGFDLWKRCMAGELTAWKEMKKYNEQDVYLLEKIYLTLRSWSSTGPNLNVYMGTTHNCPKCGVDDLKRRGVAYTKTQKYQRFQCGSCHGWSSGDREPIPKIIAK